MRAKNIEKIQKKKVGKTTIWVCKKKKGKSELETGYIVQNLSSRARGLPHAYSIITTTKKAKRKGTSRRSSSTSKVHKKVQQLASDLLGETHGHTRHLVDSHGLVPTMDSIETVRDDLLPEVTKLLQKKRKSKKDRGTIEELSNNIASLIPRPIPVDGARLKGAAIISPQTTLSINKIWMHLNR